MVYGMAETTKSSAGKPQAQQPIKNMFSKKVQHKLLLAGHTRYHKSAKPGSCLKNLQFQNL